MAHHDEVYTHRFQAGRRTYFIDVKQSPSGDRYLKMTERKKEDGRVFKYSVYVYEEDMNKFFHALEGAKEHFDLDLARPVEEENPYEAPQQESLPGEDLGLPCIDESDLPRNDDES